MKKQKEYYLNYDGGQIFFSIPSQWHVISNQDKPCPQPAGNIEDEINRALNSTIDSPPIEGLAKPGMDVVLLFDDYQRHTPVHLAIPRIMNRLNKAGVPDSRISAICATGTHPVATDEQLLARIGDEVSSRLNGRVSSHDAWSSDNIIIGRTRRGILVEVNRQVALADLIIGVGECMPHPAAGYGGGYKILMPGVASHRSVAEHHFGLMRNKNCRVNLLDGNPFWEEIIDAGRLSRLSFKLDFVMNEKRQVIKAFAGHPEAEQREAAGFAESLYLVKLPFRPDITITSASPLEIGVQSTKALHMAGMCTRSGGAIIWAAAQKQAGPIFPLIQEMASPLTANEIHRNFMAGMIPDHLKKFGVSYLMQIVSFKEASEKYNIIHVTEGLTPEQVQMMGMAYSSNLQNAIDRLAENMPKAEVAIFASGGNIIPEVQ